VTELVVEMVQYLGEKMVRHKRYFIS